MEHKWRYRITGAILFLFLNFSFIGLAIAIDAASDPEYYAEEGEPMATGAALMWLAVLALWALAGGVIGEFVRQRRLARRASPAPVIDAGDRAAPIMIRE